MICPIHSQQERFKQLSILLEATSGNSVVGNPSGPEATPINFLSPESLIRVSELIIEVSAQLHQVYKAERDFLAGRESME